MSARRCTGCARGRAMPDKNGRGTHDGPSSARQDRHGSPRPRDTEPLSLSHDNTGGQVINVWRDANDRFPTSRERIREARDIANKEQDTLPQAGAETMTLPQRLLAITMTNSLSSQYGVPELTRFGRPVATDKSDQVETVLKATLEDLVSTPDLFGKATQDGEWGMAVIPADERWDACPVYSAEGYSFDEDDRPMSDPKFKGRDPARSRRAYDKDY